jgi:hypothetical protein
VKVHASIIQICHAFYVTCGESSRYKHDLQAVALRGIIKRKRDLQDVAGGESSRYKRDLQAFMVELPLGIITHCHKYKAEKGQTGIESTWHILLAMCQGEKE